MPPYLPVVLCVCAKFMVSSGSCKSRDVAGVPCVWDFQDTDNTNIVMVARFRLSADNLEIGMPEFVQQTMLPSAPELLSRYCASKGRSRL